MPSGKDLGATNGFQRYSPLEDYLQYSFSHNDEGTTCLMEFYSVYHILPLRTNQNRQTNKMAQGII